MSDKQKMIEKVKKLLRLAESPNEAEAAAAASKAQVLMETWQIESLSSSGDDDGESFGVGDHGVESKGQWDEWYQYLFRQLAESCDLQPYAMRGDTITLRVIGLTSDVQIFQYLWKYLTSAILKLQKKDWREERQELARPTRQMANRHRKSYCYGAVYRIVKRIKESKEERITEDQQTKALVLCKEDLVQRYIEEQRLNFQRSRRKRSSVDAEYAARGYAAAENIDLHRGIS